MFLVGLHFCLVVLEVLEVSDSHFQVLEGFDPHLEVLEVLLLCSHPPDVPWDLLHHQGVREVLEVLGASGVQVLEILEVLALHPV